MVHHIRYGEKYPCDPSHATMSSSVEEGGIMALDRTNKSLFGRWWWTIDRPTFFALFALLFLGSLLVQAASPPVAERLGLDSYYFVTRHQIFAVLAFIVMVGMSLCSTAWVRRFAFLGLAGSLLLMVLVLFVGIETKGAHRWMSILGFSIQPSEFMKPFFAVVMAWICTQKYERAYFPSYKVAIGLYVIAVGLLLAQPDFGMTVTVTAMWCIQLFMAGLPFVWVILLIILGAGGVFAAYTFLPHVANRINMFLDPSSGDSYQVRKSLEAFEHGGILGRGPGEGQVKHHLPDSHTDFIFSVAGEELGMLACVLIVCLFAFIVLRALSRVWNSKDIFTMLAVVGIIAQFGIQSIINMGVAINLLPPKGMTLPFISYGGSSTIAVAIGMGMLLALTRKRYGKK